MAIGDLNLVDLTPEILKLESIAASATNSQRAEAISRIESITKTAVHQGTVAYGLRVLSGLGYTGEQLLRMAREYNSKGQWLGIQLGHPYDKDPLHLHFFYIKAGTEFTQIDVD